MDQNVSLSTQRSATTSPLPERLPWNGLIALALAGFICILTETIPAGLLIEIGHGLGVTESLAGQLITSYALGSLLAAIPLTTATQAWRRKPLLLLCIVGFLLFNTITAFSFNYTLTLIARFLAGVTAGILWGMTAGYARLMAPESLRGKAMAVAMAGTPLALAFGVPLGTFLGSFLGWRSVFGIISLLSLILVIWVLSKVPDFPGQSKEKRISLLKVFVTPGVRSVLFVVLAWILSHNILYTYIAPYLDYIGLAPKIDMILLIFGISALVGIWIIGILIDSKLRLLVLISIAGFGMASVILGIGLNQTIVVYFAVTLWGLTFGGAATLLQTAIANAGRDSVDIAQSMLVTTWNLAIGGGSVVGAFLLETVGVYSFPWVMFCILLVAYIIVWRAKTSGFTQKQK
ncbi:MULTISPECIES: MFS transporter [Bacillus]|uniref:MFS transporter n=1 Tax=Bacillus TaxID=1386 RepID=UPI000A30358B|nr:MULTISPECIES: MFS transporter [Bacillus]MCU5384988.1 MFS transporter [Bacillus cereus]MEB5652121.1 MFS transporter [Bacillus anthracis]MEC3855327.1 MFS transporter [Bacillus sp. WOD8 KX774193]WAI12445.1 MFS transporter [Bacillus cereus]SME37972.1 Purine ribonucleoside efflux pump NepI [Bacillus cereus]